MTRISFAHCQHPGGEAAAGAAAALYACTEAKFRVGCLAPQMNARGLARGCHRDAVGISPGLPCGDTDPHARGYGYGRETLCAARRDARARARDTLLGCRGPHSRAAGALNVTSAIPVSTCERFTQKSKLCT